MLKQNVISTNKKKIPQWTTYFSGSPKRQKVIFKIIFYAQNPKKTCYASLKRIAQETKTHINTVYDAIKMACAIGILKKKESIEIYATHPLTGKPLFNKKVKLTYLGDTPMTAGEECFGSLFSSSNRGKKGETTRGYIKKKELSYKRVKEESLKKEVQEKKKEIYKNFYSLEEILKEVSHPKTKDILFQLEKRREASLKEES